MGIIALFGALVNVVGNVTFIIISISVFFIQRLILSGITTKMNRQKGYKSGYSWGLFFGMIGVIVVALRPYKEEQSLLEVDMKALSRIEAMYYRGSLNTQQYERMIHSIILRISKENEQE